MIWSVSTLARSSGATSPFSAVNFSISASFSSPLAHVDEVPCDRCRGRHFRAHQMSPSARPLPALEIAVGGRGAALARLEAVGGHGARPRAPPPPPLRTPRPEEPDHGP